MELSFEPSESSLFSGDKEESKEFSTLLSERNISIY
jgi:hypothetical protein